jgi:hypothetical protein
MFWDANLLGEFGVRDGAFFGNCVEDVECCQEVESGAVVFILGI